MQRFIDKVYEQYKSLTNQFNQVQSTVQKQRIAMPSAPFKVKLAWLKLAEHERSIEV